MGAIIPGSGGLRKVRWGIQGRGRRGGVRVIYYWYVDAHQLYLLLAYDKHRQDDLSKAEIARLRDLIEED